MKTDVDKISNIYSSMFCPDKRFAPRLAVTVKQMSMESSWVMLATLEPPNDIVFVHWQIPRKPLHSTPSSFYTQNFPHREDQRNVCTDVLRRTDFIQKNLRTEQLLHTVFFAHINFCIHRAVLTHRRFYTRTPSHKEFSTQNSSYTQKFLHTEAFTQSGFYTHTIHKRFYTQTLLRRKFVAHNNS